MSENLTAISYLISAIFFILALKGLSHPESARNGNVMGIVGMIIAIVTTAFNPMSYRTNDYFGNINWWWHWYVYRS